MRVPKQEYLIYRDELLMHYTTLVLFGRKSSKDLFSQGRKSYQDCLIDKVVGYDAGQIRNGIEAKRCGTTSQSNA